MNRANDRSSGSTCKNKRCSHHCNQTQQTQHTYQNHLKLSRKTTTTSSNSKSSWQRSMFKLILLLAFVCIVSMYHYLLSKIIEKRKERVVTIPNNMTNQNNPSLPMTFSDKNMSNNIHNDNRNDNDNGKGKKDQALMIIAAVPFNEIRALSLWSQLECFTGNVDRVIITAAEYSKELMNPFVEEITRTMPQFKDGTTSLEVRYFVNDRYDSGLWCDALKGDVEVLNNNAGDALSSSPVVQQFDQFILVNDSVMAIQRSTELLDVLRSKNLDMISLTYSLLGGSYWLEANYRGFSREGIHKLMDHICVPNPCQVKKNVRRRHRCMVDTFEIPTAGLFDRSKVWGLYHGDAPIQYFNATAKNKPMQTSPMWHSNYPFWNEILREKLHFPAAKISNRWLYTWLLKRNKADHDRCLTLLQKSPKAAKMASDFESLMVKADSVNQIEFKKYDNDKNQCLAMC